MSAENMNEQERSHIKDNEIVQLEDGTSLAKLCKVDSLSNISSKFDVDVGLNNEQECCNDKVDDLSIIRNSSSQISFAKDDSPRPSRVIELSDDYVMQMTKNLNDRNIALYEGVFLDADKQTSPPLQETPISDESEKANKDLNKLELIVKNVDNTDEKSMEIDFHIEKDSEQRSIDDKRIENNNNEEQSCFKEASIVVDTHIEKDDEKEGIDENKMENNSVTNEESCSKETIIKVDYHIEENIEDGSIDTNETSKPDLLPSKELLLVDESNDTKFDSSTTKSSLLGLAGFEKESSIENVSVKLADNGNGNQFNDGSVLPDKLENLDLKKAFPQSDWKDITCNRERDMLIENIHHMPWLKAKEHEMMEVNRKKMACQPTIEKEEYYKDIQEELTEDTKPNTKASKKRPNQRRNLKNKATDSSKQNDIEDKNKKSSNDVGSNNEISKNEISKTTIGRTTEMSKDTKTIQHPASQKICIGRGRGDRRGGSFGTSQSRGQNDTGNQRNKTRKSSPEDKFPSMVEKSSNKSEAHFHAQDSSNKVEKIENSTENMVVNTDSTKPIKQEVRETKSDSKSHQDVEFSHTQSAVENIQIKPTKEEVANTAQSSTQENKGKVDVKKNQLPPKDHQESHNRSATNWQSRPIYGRSTDKSNSEKMLFPARGFGPNTNEHIKNNNQPSQRLSSKDNYNRFSEPANRNQHESKVNQSYSSLLKDPEESCSSKYTKSSSTYDQDFPRWNHNNNHPDKQNIKRDDRHTSNRHRNIADEKRENEESLGKNRVFADKSQGSRRYSDKFQDSRTPAGRYSDRNQDNNNFHDKHTDKNQDDKNSGERYANRSQDCKSYQDIDSDRPQASNRDTYFDNNHRSRGFGERFPDVSQDRPCGNNYSNKFRDNRSSSDRYSGNQSSKTSSERFYNKKHDDSEVITEKQEFLNRSPVSLDKNENCRDKNHTATKNLDFSSKSQELPDKSNEISDSAGSTYSQNHPLNEDVSKNCSEKNHESFNEDNYRYQDTSNNVELEYNVPNVCPHQQEQLEQFKNNFWPPPNEIDQNQNKQYKSDVKSQKQLDNTQQAKVQMELNQILQRHSIQSVECQQEFSSAVDQNAELYGRITQLPDMSKNQPNQSDDWSSYKNTAKPDAAYSSEFQSALPYDNANSACSPAAISDYNLPYNQILLDSSSQFNSSLAPGQKPNVVMAFEGNQNVQQALGMDPRTVNQSQFPHVNNSDLSRSKTNNSSQPIYTNQNVAQFFQTTVASSQTTMACMHSTMNVNAQPFEVTKQFNQESNKEPMYVMQPTASNHSHDRFVVLDDGSVLDVASMNEISNNCEEYLKLNKEISDLQRQLAVKQAELLNFQVKMFKIASAADKARLNAINQQINLPNQYTSNNHLVQESNQTLPSSYVQVKHPNCPPGFGNVSMDLQGSSLNICKMLPNVANAQNYTSDSLPSNSLSAPKSNAQPVYLAQDNIYQQQTATYPLYADRKASSAAYMMPHRAEQRQIKGFNHYSK